MLRASTFPPLYQYNENIDEDPVSRSASVHILLRFLADDSSADPLRILQGLEVIAFDSYFSIHLGI